MWWQEEEDGPGFWAVTTLAEATQVNRDYEHFSSARQATYLWELAEDDLAQQQLIMLNMDPPLHTRYRRLVNKGFTPRMVNQLHERHPRRHRRHHRRGHRAGVRPTSSPTSPPSCPWRSSPSCSASPTRTGTGCSTGPTA